MKMTEAPEDVFPQCPYCKQELEEVWLKTAGIGMFFSPKKQIMMCPHCKSFLGYAESNIGM